MILAFLRTFISTVHVSSLYFSGFVKLRTSSSKVSLFLLLFGFLI